MEVIIEASYFEALANALISKVSGAEVLLLNYAAESSDFSRFNHGQYRQCGRVVQGELSLRLIDQGRSASAVYNVTGELSLDVKVGEDYLKDLRGLIPSLPEDPYLLINEEVQSSSDAGATPAVDVNEIMPQLLKAGEGYDLVGIWASGWIVKAFANSLGQRNWKSSSSFHFDWTYYLDGDKAVKSAYAGEVWDAGAFGKKVDGALLELEVMKRDAIKLTPGDYRSYLAPAALDDFIGVLNWRGAFSTRAKHRKSSILMKLYEGQAELSKQVCFSQCPSRGLEAGFESSGFVKAGDLRLFEQGKPVQGLTDPRSSKEFGLPVNAGTESAGSLEMDAGSLPMTEVVKTLGEGLYLNNTHYLNTSDLTGARVTGMTRFACFWVEDGEIKAPIQVMRFDESFYRLLGEKLVALTAEREKMISGSTYHARSTGSALLPGLLVDDFSLKL